MAKERKCMACETSYSYCPNCSKSDSLKPAWYSDFCSEDCKTLWYTATGYNIGAISKEDATKVILGINLKDREQYKACLQKDLDNIIGPKTAPASTVKKAVKAPVAPKAAKTPVVEKAETVHEVVNKTEEK